MSVTTDQTYNHMSFESDEFSATNTVASKWGTKWVVEQTLPGNLSVGTAPGGAFPALSHGICKLPYTQTPRFQTITSRVDTGAKLGFAEFQAGLTNFPTGPLLSWTLEETLIDTEVTVKIAHFIAQYGRCFGFNFTDEGGTVFPGCFYASDTMIINRLQYNQSRISTKLVQMN